MSLVKIEDFKSIGKQLYEPSPSFKIFDFNKPPHTREGKKNRGFLSLYKSFIYKSIIGKQKEEPCTGRKRAYYKMSLLLKKDQENFKRVLVIKISFF